MELLRAETLTPRGRAMLVAAAIVFGLLAVVPDQGVAAVVTLAMFMVSFIYVSRLVFDVRVSIARKLVVERELERPMIEHRPLRVRLVLRNPTRMPLEAVEVSDSYPVLFKLLEGSYAGILYVPARGSAVLEYVLDPLVGKHIFGGPRIVVRDPAGLFSEEITLSVPTTIFVQPRIETIKLRGVLAVPTLRPGGLSTTRRRGIGMEFFDVREYVPGDEYRRIEWKATARSGRLMVKEFEQESSLEVMLVIDVSETMSYGVLGSTKLEYTVRGAASIADYLIRRGDFVGIAYNLPTGEIVVVKPGRGPQQRRRIINALSQIEWPKPGVFAGRRLPSILRKAFTSTRRGRNLFIVFSDLEVGYQELSRYADYLSQLRALRNEVVVISPFTPLFEVKGLTGLGAALYRLYTARSLKKREEAVRGLLSRGVPVVDVGPEDLVSHTLLRIELMRQRMT